VVKVIWHKAAS